MQLLIGRTQAVVHLCHLQKVFDYARCINSGLVVAYGQAQRSSRDEHACDVAQDARLELWRPRLGFSTAVQGLVREGNALRIGPPPPPRPFPLQAAAAAPLLLPALHML